MTLKEYHVACARTCPSLGSTQLDTLHMNIGIATETGEILDAIKRKIAYKKEVDIVNIEEEIGDTCWYICNRYNMTSKNKDMLPEPFEYKIDNIESLANILLSISPTTSYTILISIVKCTANFFNLDFETCLDKNIAKLYARYPEKFTEELAINRNTDNERKILEKDI